MFLLDRFLVSGVRFVLNTLVTAAEAEDPEDPARIREELLDLQMRFELGEVLEDEFSDREADLMARLRALRESEPIGIASELSSSGAEVVIETHLDGRE